MTHAISPISLKLSQMIKVIKLFKSPKKFGLLVNPDVEFYSRVVQCGSLANSLLQLPFGLALF